MAKWNSHIWHAGLLGVVVVSFTLGSIYLGLWKSQAEVVTLSDESNNIRFGWWGNDDRHDYTLKGIDLFESLNNDSINVEYSFGVWNGYERRNRVYMMSDTEPDVMQINYNWLYEYSADGDGYYDLSKLSDVIDFSGYSDEDLKYGTMNGKLNAVPIAYNALVFYYNKDIYDKYGLDIPKTWDDLFAAAKVMRDDGIYPLGIGQKHLFLALIAYYEQATGQKLFDESGKYIGDEEALEVMLKFYKRLMDEKVIPYFDKFGTESFISEECAGTTLWANDADRYCKDLLEEGRDIVLGQDLMTANPKAYGWYSKPATMYAISNDTDDPEDAGRLLDFLINNGDMAVLQGTEKGIPANANARNKLDEDGLLTGSVAEAGFKVLNNLDRTSIMIPSMEDTDVLTAFTEESDKYIYDQDTLENCASSMNRQFAALLNTEK